MKKLPPELREVEMISPDMIGIGTARKRDPEGSGTNHLELIRRRGVDVDTCLAMMEEEGRAHVDAKGRAGGRDAKAGKAA